MSAYSQGSYLDISILDCIEYRGLANKLTMLTGFEFGWIYSFLCRKDYMYTYLPEPNSREEYERLPRTIAEAIRMLYPGFDYKIRLVTPSNITMIPDCDLSHIIEVLDNIEYKNGIKIREEADNYKGHAVMISGRGLNPGLFTTPACGRVIQRDGRLMLSYLPSERILTFAEHDYVIKILDNNRAFATFESTDGGKTYRMPSSGYIEFVPMQK